MSKRVISEDLIKLFRPKIYLKIERDFSLIPTIGASTAIKIVEIVPSQSACEKSLMPKILLKYFAGKLAYELESVAHQSQGLQSPTEKFFEQPNSNSRSVLRMFPTPWLLSYS